MALINIFFSFHFPVCIGTNGRMSVPANREHHYRNLRDRYTNCTYVDGNLELTWLQVRFFKKYSKITPKVWLPKLELYVWVPGSL